MSERPGWRAEVEGLVRSLEDTLGDLPYEPTPRHLYRPSDLYDAGSSTPFTGSVDQRIYRRARHANMQFVPPAEALAQRLHDHGIAVALQHFVHGREVVGVMGGHALERGSAGYRRVVDLGAALARAGFCVATGGGPGAMEAANLGAAASGLGPVERAAIVDGLAGAPTFATDADRFVRVGLDAAGSISATTPNLAIPTWFYGHEPTNAFATAVAKYFSNSEREDSLLAVATAGIVFVPGGPGTLQEVFQEAAQNAYETYGPPSPMVFLAPAEKPGFWRDNGVLPALDRGFSYDDGERRPGWDLVTAVSQIDDVVAWLIGSLRGSRGTS